MKISASPVIAARGGTRSATESSVSAPTTWANEEPNMLSAASSDDPVAPKTRVASAIWPMVRAASWTVAAAKSGVNSGTPKMSR